MLGDGIPVPWGVLCEGVFTVEWSTYVCQNG